MVVSDYCHIYVILAISVNEPLYHMQNPCAEDMSHYHKSHLTDFCLPDNNELFWSD